MSLREEKGTQIVYTGSLLNQELHPVPKSHWVIHWAINTDYTQKPPKKLPWTLQETHFLWHDTHKKCWSWEPQEHTTLLGYNTKNFKELHLFTEQTEINTNVILFHSLLRKPKLNSECSKTWKQSLTTEKLKYVFLVCYKT